MFIFRLEVGAHLRTEIFLRWISVGSEYHDVIPSSPQPLDEALKAIFHATYVAEGARLLSVGWLV